MIQPDSEEGSGAQLCFPPLNVATLHYPNRTPLSGFLFHLIREGLYKSQISRRHGDISHTD